MISHVDLLTRIIAGAIMGAAIGYERDIHGRHVGLRTHLLVGMASATFMVVSEYFFYFQNYSNELHNLKIDTAHMASAVISGIGFLAGGAILRTGTTTIQGLTTAAGLWLVTAIGLCSGAGMYIEAVVVTLLGIFSLTVLRHFESKNDNMIRRKVSLMFGESGPCIEHVTSSFSQLGATVSDINYDKQLEHKRSHVTCNIQIPIDVSLDELTEKLERQKDIKRIQIQNCD